METEDELVGKIAERLLLDADEDVAGAVPRQEQDGQPGDQVQESSPESEEPDTEEHDIVPEGRAARPHPGEVETRRHEVTVDGKKIRGLVPYNVQSRDMGGWTEVISPLALRNANLDELVARVDHAGRADRQIPAHADP